MEIKKKKFYLLKVRLQHNW